MNLRRFTLTLALAFCCLGQSAFAQMPKPALVGYWQNWSSNLKLTDIPNEYNVIQLAFATTVGSSLYQMEFNRPYNYGKTQFMADIDELHSEGKKVILSIGGASDPVRLDDETAKNAFINSINAILADYEYKMDGIDIDFESSSMEMGDDWQMGSLTPIQQNLVDAIRSIKSTYETQSGKTMLLTMAPETLYLVGGLSNYQLNNSHGSIFLPIIEELEDEIDLLHPQFYNAYESVAIDGKVYSDDWNPNYVTAIAESIMHGFTLLGGKGTFNGFPEEKFALGIPANQCDGGTGSGFLTPEDMKNAVDYLRGDISKPAGFTYTLLDSYPNLAGLMTWSINTDKANCDGSYLFANTYTEIFTENNVTSTEAGLNESLRFYPNPATNQIQLEGYADMDRVEILSLDGRTLLSTDNTSAPINIEGLDNGVYLIQAQNGEQTLTSRLMKQ